MRVKRGISVALAGLLVSASSVAGQGLIGGNGLCADPASLGPNAPVGGFAPVEDPSSNDVVTQAAQAAATQYFDKDENSCYQEVIDICGADAQSFADSVQVTAACTQVVAGTNVKVAFSATIPCSDANKAKLSNKDLLTQEFEADVFVPLPSSNEAVDVTSVKETSGKCVKTTTSPAPAPESSPPPSPSPEGMMVGGNGLCADPASLGPNAPVGGFAPVEDPSSNDVVTQAAQVAATEYFDNYENSCYQEVIDICGADAQSFADSVQVTAACTQVVAGTNVKVAFSTTIPCSDADKLSNKDLLTQEFEADVFVPLPSSNEAIQMTSMNETSGICPYLSVGGAAPSSAYSSHATVMALTAGIVGGLFL